MRYLAIRTNARGITRRVLLVDNPQDERYRGCIVSHTRMDAQDGPPHGGQVYQGYTLEELFQEFENDYDVRRDSWKEIPDQLPGCEDGWVGPVRQARNDQGVRIMGLWERLVDGEWVRIGL
jgi:hypothetical protein